MKLGSCASGSYKSLKSDESARATLVQDLTMLRVALVFLTMITPAATAGVSTSWDPDSILKCLRTSRLQ